MRVDVVGRLQRLDHGMDRRVLQERGVDGLVGALTSLRRIRSSRDPAGLQLVQSALAETLDGQHLLADDRRGG